MLERIGVLCAATKPTGYATSSRAVSGCSTRENARYNIIKPLALAFPPLLKSALAGIVARLRPMPEPRIPPIRASQLLSATASNHTNFAAL